MSLDQPRVMGILNATPDSFSDGGRYFRKGRPDLVAIVDAAAAMIEAGASMIDVGGESTRPGSEPVEESDELSRVIPVVERLCELDTIVSVDTCKPAVARAALRAGAHFVNDVNALREAKMLETVAESDAGVCLMHMQGRPRTMQDNPTYADVVSEVADFLAARTAACRASGVASDRIVLDPGFGFGKRLEHNLALLRGLGEIAALGQPVMVGLSRKGMIGAITGRETNERVAGSVSASVIAVMNGASLVRAHDVPATVDALRVAHAVRGAGGPT